MTRALFWISLLACTLVGVLHTIIGLSSFEPLSPSYVWFLGAGLAFLLNAALNVAAWRAPRSDRLVKGLVQAANLLMLGLGLLAVRGVEGSRPWLAVAAAIGLLVSHLSGNRGPRTADEASRKEGVDRAVVTGVSAGEPR